MKILLLDADGVVLQSSDQYFSAWYAEKFGVPAELLAPFFKNEYQECQLGNADLKEQVGKNLSPWKWTGTVNEFLKCWFEHRRILDEQVMIIARKLRQSGVQCYVASNQEKYRALYLWEEAGMAEEFDGAFFSYEMRVKKNNPQYWEIVLQKLGKPNPGAVEYWDNDVENITVAKQAGIDAHLFTTVEDFQNTFGHAEYKA
jgi:putative hydrolase of the HAD superfamily